MAVFINKKNFKKRSKRFAKTLALMLVFTALATAGGVNFLENRTSDLGESEASVSAAADGNWGLSFQSDGKAPVGNATPEELAKYNAYFVGGDKAVEEKAIFLTFDAGYENGNTEKILDTLKKHNAPACFFLVGNYIETSPEIVKRMVAEGHTVGDHRMHPDMSAIGTEEAFKAELNDLEEKYKEVTGQDMMKIYRPPQGKYSESNLKMASDMGYKTVFWSLAYVDWYESKQPTKQEAFNKLIPRIHPGAVVLLHSTSKTNGEILDELLTKWEEAGYTFKPITELA